MHNKDIEIAVENPCMSMILTPFRFMEDKFQAGSIRGSIFTLLDATFGAGVVVLPYATSQAGLLLQLSELIFCGILGYYSMFLLVRAADRVKRYSYGQLAKSAYGNKFELAVKCMFFLNCLASSTFNTVVINQLVTKALAILWGDALPFYMTNPDGKFWQPIVTAAVIFPLCLFRNLTSLRYAGLLAFTLTFYIATVVTVEAFNTSISDFSENLKNVTFFNLNGLSISLPSTIFAFMCHPNVLDTFKELQQSSRPRMSSVLTRLMMIVFTVYIFLGFFGYTTFANNPGELSSGNILYANYKNDVVITAGVLLLGLSCILTQPLCIKPAKDALRDIIFPFDWNATDKNVNIDPTGRHFLLVAVVVFSQMSIGMFFSSLLDIVEFSGSFVAPIICFILPSIFFLRLDPHAQTSRTKLICWFHLTLMSGYTVYSTLELFLRNS